jgi:hypothetical protein
MTQRNPYADPIAVSDDARPGAAGEVWTLQPKNPAPWLSGSRHWTAQGDYTRDVGQALQFKSDTEAERWLRVHKHLRGTLKPARAEHGSQSQ